MTAASPTLDTPFAPFSPHFNTWPPFNPDGGAFCALLRKAFFFRSFRGYVSRRAKDRRPAGHSLARNPNFWRNLSTFRPFLGLRCFSKRGVGAFFREDVRKRN